MGLLLIISYNFYSYFVYKNINIVILYSDPYEEHEIESISFIAQSRINTYCIENNIKYIFQLDSLSVPHSKRAAYLAMEILKQKKINYIIGYDSSFLCDAIVSNDTYADFILISPNSSSDDISNNRENLYRLKCIDSRQGYIISNYLVKMNKSDIIILGLNSTWSYNIIQKIESELNRTRINIYSKIIYNIEDIYHDDFYKVLNNHYNNIKSEKKIDNVIIISVGILDTIHILEHTRLNNVTWICMDALSSFYLEERIEEFKSINNDIYVFTQTSQNCTLFKEINEEYRLLTQNNLDFTQAARYDAAWIFALSLINSDSLETQQVTHNIPIISKSYTGLTGNCSLTNSGDRLTVNYNLLKLSSDNRFIIVGYFNSTLNEFMFKDKYK